MTRWTHAIIAAMVAGSLSAQPLPGTGAAKSANYPVRTIRFVIPFPPAGTADTLARGVGQKLAEFYGQAMIMDNRPGAGGNLASEIVAKSKPDGYTLIIATPGPFAANVTLQAGKLSFDPIRDFEPISLLARSPLILITHPSIPAHSIAELLRLARSRPGELNYATPGNGTANHLVMETFNKVAGIRIAHIPFKGTAQSLVALLGGDIELLMGQIPSTRTQIAAGKVRPLALSGTRRSQALPNVPTFAESGVRGVEATSWFGVAAPAGTPAEILQRLAADIAKAVASPDLKAKYVTEGVEPETNTPSEYAAFIRAEVERWGQAVKYAGITAN